MARLATGADQRPAAACFVKAFGITFLALPRLSEAAHAHESPFSMQCGMGLLALAACIGLGVAPFAAVPFWVILAGLGGLPDTRAEFTYSVFRKHPGSLDRCRPH